MSNTTDKKAHRFRVTIPDEAEQILEWFNNQSNISYSVMDVLREHIGLYGTGNVFARRIESSVNSRGRPTNELRREVINTTSRREEKVQKEEKAQKSKQKSVPKQQTNNPKTLKPKSEENLDEDGFFDIEQAIENDDSMAGTIAEMLNNS